MGNCVAPSTPRRDLSWQDNEDEDLSLMEEYDHTVLKIVRTDGKVLEYSSSMLVKDLQLNFQGFAIGVSRHASHLPPEHELKAGRVYYLLPKAEEESGGSCKRVKLVLTKQQLQKLISENTTIEDVLLTYKVREDENVSYSTSWTPRLETIQEEI